MASEVKSPDYLYGLHGPGGEDLFIRSERPGWILFDEVLGADPVDQTGGDYGTFSARGLGVICRLNYGRQPHGTIPHSSMYGAFSERVAAYVASSSGCHIWIIGNEMNYAVERPGVQVDWSRHPSVQGETPADSDPLGRGLAVRFNVLPDHSTEIRTTRGALVSPGEVITPELYARCFRQCRDAIRKTAGHEQDQVLVGAVAPWNSQSIYPGNANGDWIQYFRDILERLGPANCDGFTLHAYTHGHDPELITSEEKLAPPYQNYHLQFRGFQDLMEAVPPALRHLPVYITEADPGEPWQDENNGWIQRAYAEVDQWNKQPGNQKIRALILYQWPQRDRWHISGRSRVVEDLLQALEAGYRWTESKGLLEPVSNDRTGKSERRPAEPPTYRVQWLEDKIPAKLTAGQVVTIPVTIRNTGSSTWEWGGEKPFRVAYRYYRNRRQLSLGEDKEIHTDIAEDVPPGSSTTVNVRVALPDESGNYTIEFDLVHEGVTRFKEEGSPALTRWLTIEAKRALARIDGGPEENALPVPLFADVSKTLPRASIPYARRSLSQIKYIVLSHTGANPRLSLERIANTHIRYGYPGIAYDFVVDPVGQVFRVSELEDVAQPDQIWSEQGVNVCLAGDFATQNPPMAQLDAAGRLCAWLAQNLGLAPENIVGLGELTKTESPGRSFYTGHKWKTVLARQVRLHLAALTGSGDFGRVRELTSELEIARSRQQALETRLKAIQTERERIDSDNSRLHAEIAELQQKLAEDVSETAGGLRIHKWAARLPRDETRYQPRRAQDVRFIVINHTGVAHDVSLQELAEAHMPDWPGILYDYTIDTHGEVYQTQPLEEVVATDEVYLSHAINVAFAGNFDQQVPNNDQLYSGGRLIAWLLERFPQLRIEHVRGVSEFIDHDSPGEQWLNGQCWKEMLLAAVRRTRGLVEPSEMETRLRTKIAEAERKIIALERESRGLIDERDRLESENQKLLGQVSERQQESGLYIVPQPAMRVIVDQLPKHPTLRYDRRKMGQISHIAVHHTATPPSMGPHRIAELHVAADGSRGKESWPGIGYHYFVHADGTIDQTNHLETASFHVFRHNVYSVGIVFAGSFMNGKIPTSAQMRAGAHLVAWLMQELNIPLARVWGHREFPDNSTVCPGSEWTLGNRWRDLLFERIEQIQAGVGVKSVRHYLLFWQRAYPGPLARQDLVNAINYVVRFRPTVGFSLQDARNAEYVTIVGGEAGVSSADERTLRASGCRVERIAGRNEEETGRILSEMANQGRRFRTFEVDF